MLRPSLESTVERIEAAAAADDADEYLALTRTAAARLPREGVVLMHLLAALSANERWDEAADEAAIAVTRSTDPAMRVTAAWAFGTVGRMREANSVLDDLLTTGPHDAYIQNEALFLRGMALGALGRPHLAEKFLRDALARDHQRPDFIWGLANLLVVHDRADEATELVAVAQRIEDDALRTEALADLAELGLHPRRAA